MRAFLTFLLFTLTVSCTTIKTTITKERIIYNYPNQKNRNGRQITFETTLKCNAQEVWKLYQKPTEWLDNLNPQAKLRPTSTNKEIKQWTIGKNYSFILYMYGVIPFGKHHIIIESIDSTSYVIQSRERGFLVPHWDNNFEVIHINDSTCILKDILTIQTKGINSIVTSYAIGVFKAKHKKLKQKFE